MARRKDIRTLKCNELARLDSCLLSMPWVASWLTMEFENPRPARLESVMTGVLAVWQIPVDWQAVVNRLVVES